MLCIRKALECLSALRIPYPHQCCVKKGSLILSGPQILRWGLISQEHRAAFRRILGQVRTWQLASPGLVPGEDGGSRKQRPHLSLTLKLLVTSPWSIIIKLSSGSCSQKIRNKTWLCMHATNMTVNQTYSLAVNVTDTICCTVRKLCMLKQLQSRLSSFKLLLTKH